MSAFPEVRMERTANIPLTAWSAARPADRTRASARLFAALLIASACLSATLASWLPLQASIVTVFLFAGPHNWFEARYFLMRLPARFGRSRNFFLLAFGGIGFLTLAYVSLPALHYAGLWSGANWPNAIATWNTLMLLWIGALVLMLAKQKARRDRSWAVPVVFILCVTTIPLARRSQGFPKLIAAILIFGVFAMAVLWFGFSVKYSATRDIYFAIAMAHVLAEAPFLLRMI